MIEFSVSNGLPFDLNVPCGNFLGETPLHAACSKGHYDIVEFLLNQGIRNIDINFLNNSGTTALSAACYNGHQNIVQLILDHSLRNHIDINIPNNDGWTPLHYACFYGENHIVKLLLQHQLDTNNLDWNNQDNIGRTVLHDACQKGHIQVVQTLLNFAIKNDCQLNVNIKDNDGNTPIQIATQAEIIEMLSMYSTINCT